VKTALIITTYNWQQALSLSLNSALKQNILPDEIVIADDGSTPETKEIVAEFSKKSDVKIIHSWQEDKGFRAAKSRNLAIKKTSADYIVCVDGDMILDKNFVKEHINAAEKGCYIQGSRVLLGQSLTEQILRTMRFGVPSLFSNQVKNNENSIQNVFLSKILSIKKSQKLKGIKSCNFSFFKNDFFKVNGFNEDFITWGREDSEFIARLYNIGIRRKNLKFGGIQYHLHHHEGHRNSKNDALLQKTIDKKMKWCENGVL
jgi:glycosyltransferase involved in cell wall biosynthesis